MNVLEDKRMVIAAAIVFLLLFTFFYPQFYHYPDEHSYLRNSFLLASGGMIIENPLYSYGYAFNGTDFVSAYPPLHSLFIMPFSLISWNLAFLSGIVLHLLNLFIFYKILQRLKLPVGYSLLYLFYPSIALMSTTLQAELSSMTCVLLATFFYLKNGKKNSLVSGFFAGLCVLARYSNALIAGAFLMAIFWKNREKAVPFIIGTIPSAIAVLAYNAWLYGSIFTTGYSILGYTTFVFEDLWIKLPYYVLLLSIAYPLMFFAMFFAKNKTRNVTVLASIFFLLLWSSYFFFYARFRIEDLVIALDKFAPVVVLMLFAYAEFLERIRKKFGFVQVHLNRIAAFLLIVLVAGTVVSMSEHKEKQDLKFEVFKKIYSETGEGALIIVDEEIASLSTNFKETPFTGMFFMESFGDRKLASAQEKYEQYITDPENTFFMRIWMSPNIEVEITPYTEKT